MKKYLVLGVLAVLFAISLSAEGNAKIKLPDGLYMYDSSVQRLKDGSDRVGFGKFFVVHNKNIYSSKEAFKKFGISKLNELFGGNKKYKILLNGEVIGEKYNLRFEKDEAIDREDAVFSCNESYIAKNIKEGPAYRVEGIYVGRLGSVARHLAVPETYKVLRTISFKDISKEEVDKISKLVKEKLLPLVKNRKELKKNKINEMELAAEGIDLLDKISYGSREMFIGIYWYGFKAAKRGERVQIVFSANKEDVYDITSNYNNDILSSGGVKIHGLLDFDGCGKEELIIEKEYGGLYQSFRDLEIYKQKTEGNWTLIKKNSWKEEL